MVPVDEMKAPDHSGMGMMPWRDGGRVICGEQQSGLARNQSVSARLQSKQAIN